MREAKPQQNSVADFRHEARESARRAGWLLQITTHPDHDGLRYGDDAFKRLELLFDQIYDVLRTAPVIDPDAGQMVATTVRRRAPRKLKPEFNAFMADLLGPKKRRPKGITRKGFAGDAP